MENKAARKFPRISANFLVEFTLGGKKFGPRATTLGGGGLFVILPDPPPVGTELVLRFRPARHLGFLETKARVVYHGRDGAALEFLNISPEEQQILLRLIHHKTGNRRKHPRAKLATQVEWQGLSSLALSRDVSVGELLAWARSYVKRNIQHPTSNIQRSSKSQTPNFRFTPALSPR